MNDIRRLRAEGHTHETIRLSLLDAGISVSISTVIREARRPPTRWDLDHAQAELAISETGPTHCADTESDAVPQAAEPATAQPSGLASGTAGEGTNHVDHGQPSVGWLSSLLGVLLRLRRLLRWRRAGSVT